MIEIHLNGDVREIDNDIDLRGLIELFSLPVKRIAVEVNGDVVRRVNWPDTRITNGDRIEVVHLVGGG